MTTKSKLIYLTPEQQLWLANHMESVLDSDWCTDTKIAASAILKKLHGRKEKPSDQARFTV